jgi:hypothetical protein
MLVMITQRSVDERRNACDPGVVGRNGDTGLDMNKKAATPKGATMLARYPANWPFHALTD